MRERGPVGFALVGGALFALQNRVNGELAVRSGSAVWSAFVSFGSGVVVLCGLLAVVPSLRRAGGRAVAGRLPWWTYTGGLAGGTLVAVSAVAVPRLGVATFTVGVVAGQALGGLAVDRSRLVPGGPQPLSATRLAGAVLAVLAVAVIRLGRGDEQVSGGVVLALLVAAALGGAWGSVQQALNGRVQRATGAPLLAAWVNFAVGTAWLAVVVAVTAAAGQGPDRPWPAAPWLYVGGLLGIVYIANAAWAVRPRGGGRVGLLTRAGPRARRGVRGRGRPGPSGPPGALTYVAVVLTFLAVAVAGSRHEQPAADRAGQRPRQRAGLALHRGDDRGHHQVGGEAEQHDAGHDAEQGEQCAAEGGRPAGPLGQHGLPGAPAVPAADGEGAEDQHDRAAERRHALPEHARDRGRQQAADPGTGPGRPDLVAGAVADPVEDVPEG